MEKEQHSNNLLSAEVLKGFLKAKSTFINRSPNKSYWNNIVHMPIHLKRFIQMNGKIQTSKLQTLVRN
jgi:hypothetical protein